MIGLLGIKRICAWLVAISLLAACSSPADDFPPPSPALWQITGADGVNEGWLFGTIHELPDGVHWRTEALSSALTQSEWLVVEISDLENSGNIPGVFAELAMSPKQAPLLTRVSEDHRGGLKKLMAKGQFGEGDFTQLETWAAAITLANLLSEGKAENGVDRALIAEFAARIELEGPRTQLGIFDGLPEKEQRDFLEGVVKDSQSQNQPGKHDLTMAWLTGDLEDVLAKDASAILADPELRAALLTDRNTAWIETITAEMAQKGPLMIAVGAAHMIGDDGLPALLSAKGYSVTRIQ